MYIFFINYFMSIGTHNVSLSSLLSNLSCQLILDNYHCSSNLLRVICIMKLFEGAVTIWLVCTVSKSLCCYIASTQGASKLLNPGSVLKKITQFFMSPTRFHRTGITLIGKWKQLLHVTTQFSDLRMVEASVEQYVSEVELCNSEWTHTDARIGVSTNWAKQCVTRM